VTVPSTIGLTARRTSAARMSHFWCRSPFALMSHQVAAGEHGGGTSCRPLASLFASVFAGLGFGWREGASPLDGLGLPASRRRRAVAAAPARQVSLAAASAGGDEPPSSHSGCRVFVQLDSVGWPVMNVSMVRRAGPSAM
jgi:hypothetical protein